MLHLSHIVHFLGEWGFAALAGLGGSRDDPFFAGVFQSGWHWACLFVMLLSLSGLVIGHAQRTAAPLHFFPVAHYTSLVAQGRL
jgi:hypothetical protein